MATDRHPDWLQDARDDLLSRSLTVEAGTSGVNPVIGGVYVAQHVDAAPIDRRMVVVLNTRLEIGVADVALVTNETDMATDCDVVIPGSEAGTGFDLMFQTDLVVPMFTYQLERSVGRVEPALAAIVRRARDSECASIPAGWRGLPIVRDDDPRWQFKREELTALQALAADCVEWMIGGGPEREKYVDPALLVGVTSAEWERATSSILFLGDLMDEGWKVPAAVLGAFGESGVSLLPGDPDQALALTRLQVLPDSISEDIDVQVDPDPNRSEVELLALRRLSANLVARDVPCARMRGGSRSPDLLQSWSVGRARESRVSTHLLSVGS